MLELELRDESHAIRKTVGKQQHEPMEVDDRVLVFPVVEVEVHVTRQRAVRHDLGRLVPLAGTLARAAARPGGRHEAPEAHRRRHLGHPQARGPRRRAPRSQPAVAEPPSAGRPVRELAHRAETPVIAPDDL